MGNDQGNVPLIARPWYVVVFLLYCTTNLLAIDTPRSGRCGLFTAAVQQHWRSVEQRIQGPIPRPSLPNSVASPSGFFLVHFATTGPDAVPTVDTDSDGIPDFVEATCDALDSSFRCEVVDQGYVAPPKDNLRGGTDQLDVYLRDMSKVDAGMYGRTVPDTLITNVSQPSRYLAFIEIDNDFDSTNTNSSGQSIFATYGIDALRVTCAHELHHAIQMGSYALSKTQAMMYEMTSTWMEYRVFPALRDNQQYLERLLLQPEAYPFGEASADNGYYWWWFGNVLHAEGGDALLRSVWEGIATGSKPFTALVDACYAHGRPFADLFCSNVSALYHTGQRTTSSTVLPDAALLPSIAFHVDEGVTPPAVTSGGRLRAFEVRAFRYTVPSASNDKPVVVGALITNPDVQAMVGSEPTTQPYVLRLESTNSGASTPIPGSTWLINVWQRSNCMYVDGVQTSSPMGPYPQPLLIGRDDAVYIPVPFATQGDVATLRVYTTDMVGLAEASTTAIIDGSRIVVSWSPINYRPGIYLVEVDCAQRVELFKVVIK